MSAQHTIDTLRKTLAALVTDWKPDSHVPPNFIREDGLGNEIARVDRWCGIYQHPPGAYVVGWRALGHSSGSSSQADLVLRHDFPDVEAAIEYAKAQADAALIEFGWAIEEPVTTEREPFRLPNLRAYQALTKEMKYTVLDENEQAEYEDLATMASEKGYPALAHALDPIAFPEYE